MKPNYQDERGTITDLLVTDDYSITHITFNKGAVRGNHYHEHTTQHDFILKGKFICATENNLHKDSIELTRGHIQYHGIGVSHAYKALEYSEMLSICFGIRKGADYEKDVIRLEGKDKLL